jgi:hypothetical protein
MDDQQKNEQCPGVRDQEIRAAMILKLMMSATRKLRKLFILFRSGGVS